MKKFVSEINHPIVHLSILVLLVVIVYVNTLGNQFVWDDSGFIKWPMIRSFSNTIFFLKGVLPGEHFGDYRPLKGIILAIDFALFNIDPWGYHMTAILIHAATTIAVYLVTREIIKNQMRVGMGTISFLTAALFAVHPIHTEAVTFVTSSSDIIGVTFFLFAFYFYIKATSGWLKVTSLALSLFFAFFGYIAYEMTLVLPIILILYDICFSKLPRSEWKGRAKIYAFYFGLIVVYAVWRYGILHVTEGQDYPGQSFIFTMIAMVKVFGKYIELTIWPHDLTVAHEISPGIHALAQGDFNRAAYLSQKVTDPQFIISLTAILGLLAFALISFKKRRMVTFGIIWFFLSLAAVSNIFPLGTLMTERYLYLASYGYCLLLAWALYQLAKRRLILKFLTGCFIILLLAYYSFIAINRNSEWKDEFTLWTVTVARSPESSLANFNLAAAYEARNDLDTALKYYHVAYDRNDNKLARFPLQLAETYSRKGDNETAIRYYKEALDISNTDFEKYYSQARIYQISKQESLAIEAYKRTILANSERIYPHVNLGIMYAEQKKWDKAIHEFQYAKALDPSLIHPYVNLAYCFEQVQNYAKAEVELKRAHELFPDNTDIVKNLDRLKSKVQSL